MVSKDGPAACAPGDVPFLSLLSGSRWQMDHSGQLYG